MTVKEIRECAELFAETSRMLSGDMKGIHAQQSAVRAQYVIAEQLAELNATMLKFLLVNPPNKDQTPPGYAAYVDEFTKKMREG